MSENSKGRNLAPADPAPRYDSTVEEIIRLRYGWYSAMEPVEKLVHEKTGKPLNPQIQALQADRTRMLSLPREVLAREYAVEAAKLEARQFFNLPEAMADFEHWSLMDIWSAEESAALLLGRNPDVVKWEKLKKYEYRNSPFAQRFGKLLQIVQRADDFRTDRIKPADAWTWAERSKVITPPAGMTHWLRARGHIAEVDLPPAEGGPGTSPDEGPGPRWTPERLAELSAYREKHGTRQAAEHFGISEARVRKLLPRETKTAPASSIFTYRPK
jgi:hypothetical protein